MRYLRCRKNDILSKSCGCCKFTSVWTISFYCFIFLSFQFVILVANKEKYFRYFPCLLLDTCSVGLLLLFFTLLLSTIPVVLNLFSPWTISKLAKMCADSSHS